MPLRRIARRTGLLGNKSWKYLPSGLVEPQPRVPLCDSKRDPFAQKAAALAAV